MKLNTIARQLAERTGFHVVYPADNDPLGVTRLELERFVNEVFDEYNLSGRIGQDASGELAREIAAHVRRQFVRRIPYTGADEIDMDAPARPDAIEGEERVRQLRSFTATLMGRGLNLHEVSGCAIVWNDSRNAPPLPDREVVAITRDLFNRAARKAA